MKLFNKNIKSLISQRRQQIRLDAISALTTGVAHEFGQPITNIRFTVQFYRRKFEKESEDGKIDREEVFKVFDSILEETQRLGALNKRLSPLTSSKSVTETFDVVERIKKRLEAEDLRIKNSNITVAIFSEGVVSLNADPVIFDQLINNLLVNAIDAINEKKAQGAGKIDIRVKGDYNKDYIRLEFEDNGVGIPVKDIEKVFHPFFTTKPAGNGEGLGLFIAHNILKMYGGTISIDKTFNNGTRFIIIIPKDIEF
ncbi:MAG: HAMP domain-containing sensor histidine kinase [Candidatus Magnetobacterium sp. LHC-1]|uniref:histidine kinase n=1 Tax=Candidatus Magnetobacterium casense TaxID=1455061 RepID=A0ABS6S1N8_9BACT|nr:HAMP domain-containing sensor histidine kinase [Candidatus Magnetobacterium casensis]MBF0607659.1 HAMP domain-containing histidine kinase [Nitrospirota bacterium]MBV6342763.1 HAMP domain-containing histidine kinase [Candidatus Magnetobacterium casensis]